MSQVESIVLDEADRMLDMGFAEELEAIFSAAPNRKHTHLVSATLEPEVLHLANRYQKAPLHIQGTRYGEAHADIEHLVHLVDPRHRFDALVNLLLLSPDERTLVFARTRADVGNIADDLAASGFRVGALSGDMEQPARDRALAAFRQGKVTTLVATDVAARGIDVENMTRVIQVDPPLDPESYTHRSGRTGRAGQKGTSIVLLAPAMQRRFRALLAQARVQAKFLPLPSPEVIRAGTDERTLKSLAEGVCTAEPSERLCKLAERLLLERDPVVVVASLIGRSTEHEPEPRNVPVIFPESLDKPNRKTASPQTRTRGRDTNTRRDVNPSDSRDRESFNDARRGRNGNGDLRRERNGYDGGSPSVSAPRNVVSSGAKCVDWSNDTGENWGTFHVTWGNLQGADARRLLAVICRRGGIRGADVGAIRIGPTTSTVEVRGSVAAAFATRALEPDPQEPRIRITPLAAEGNSNSGNRTLQRGKRAISSTKGPVNRKTALPFPKKLKKFGRPSV
jgi:ATP-dependent RNA helicase DeaD